MPSAPRGVRAHARYGGSKLARGSARAAHRGPKKLIATASLSPFAAYGRIRERKNRAASPFDTFPAAPSWDRKKALC